MKKVPAAFTGTRDGMTPEQERIVRDLMRTRVSVLHNGSARGADAQAAVMCFDLGIYVIAHPATGVRASDRVEIESDESRDPKLPLDRNRDMVDEAELVIATPKGFVEEARGSGTWATIRHAQKTRKPLIIVWPDGTVTEENV